MVFANRCLVGAARGRPEISPQTMEEAMLVLSRKQNETIWVGDNIKVTVIKLKGNAVRIGIEAPKEMRILRGELAAWQELSFDQTSPTNQADVPCYAKSA